MAEDQPNVDHLDIGGERQLLNHAGEDGRHHQHVGQVDSQGSLEVCRLEGGGGEGDYQEEQGGQVSAQQFT